MPLRMRRSGLIETTGNAIIVKRKAILLGTAQNLQKTNDGFNNLHAGNW